MGVGGQRHSTPALPAGKILTVKVKFILEQET